MLLQTPPFFLFKFTAKETTATVCGATKWWHCDNKSATEKCYSVGYKERTLKVRNELQEKYRSNKRGRLICQSQIKEMLRRKVNEDSNIEFHFCLNFFRIWNLMDKMDTQNVLSTINVLFSSNKLEELTRLLEYYYHILN